MGARGTWVAVGLLLSAGPVLAQDDASFEELFAVEESQPAEAPAAVAEPAAQPAPEPAPAASAQAEPLPTIPVEPLRSPEAQKPLPQPKVKDGLRLEEIVVTAQRREASIQETPISMEAFSADKLAQRGIEGVEDLGANVPSMVIEPHPLSASTLRISIRGVGVSDSQVTQDPAVGIYLDGVYLARSAGLALELADLERVEVLRGPQGTLYGRNTTGGAVNMITRRPSTEAFTMQHQVSQGSRSLQTVKSSFNIPVNDQLAVKIAGQFNQQDGYVENSGPGEDFGDRSGWAARFDARYQPGDEFTVDYSYDHSDLDYNNYMFQAVIPSNTPHGQADLFKTYAQSESVYSTRRLSSMSSGPAYESSNSVSEGHTVVLDYQWLEELQTKYIGAWRKLDDLQYADLGGGKGSQGYRVDTGPYNGPAGLLAGGLGGTPLSRPLTSQEQWSHELQLSGTLFDTVDVIIGAYYFTEKGGEDGRPTHHAFNARLEPSQLDPLLDLLPGLRPLLRDAVPGIAAFWDYEYHIDNSARALFGQFTWAPDVFEEKLRLTLGLRQSWDRRYARKSFVQSQYIEFFAGDLGLVAIPIPAFALAGSDAFDNVEARREDKNFSPSFNIQYDLNEDTTTYLSYATAYKSGGFNTRDPQISAASGAASDGTNYGFGFMEGFKPEEVWSLEGGIKSQWMDGRLRFNAAVFHSQYTDMQTNFLIAGTISDTKSRNAGKARMQGLEMDGAFMALPGLVLSLQYAFLDAEVQEVIDIDGNNVAHLYPFIAAPPHSYVAAADWTFLERDWGQLRAYLSYQYTGDRKGYVITEERRGLTAIDGYGLLNARLTASSLRSGDRGTVDLAFWARNLLDEEFPLSAIDNLPHADRAVVWGEPRAYGLELVYRFE